MTLIVGIGHRDSSSYWRRHCSVDRASRIALRARVFCVTLESKSFARLRKSPARRPGDPDQAHQGARPQARGVSARAARPAALPRARAQGPARASARSCYLTDEWGCPSGEPVIGIPFYLADPKLARLEKEMNDLEDEREIMMYLRHEAGHAFNYAYELYRTPEWRDLFGPFRRPYRDDYRPVPFSRRFVRHIAGWYAQKHPDEDFAETFAVWLTPRSRWRKRYKGWGALAKLRYVDRMARRLPRRRAAAPAGPHRHHGRGDGDDGRGVLPARRSRSRASRSSSPLDTDLDDIFPVSQAQEEGRAPGGRPAARRTARRSIDKVTYWTGVQRPLVKRLVESIETRVARARPARRRRGARRSTWPRSRRTPRRSR